MMKKQINAGMSSHTCALQEDEKNVNFTVHSRLLLTNSGFREEDILRVQKHKLR